MNNQSQKDIKLSQNRVATQNRVSRETPAGEQLLRKLFFFNQNKKFAIEEIANYLEKNGRKLSRGTIYNLLSRLKKLRIIKSELSGIAKYSLDLKVTEEGREINPILVVSRGDLAEFPPMDPFRLVERLPLEELGVHRVDFWVLLQSVGFLDGTWTPNSKKHAKYFGKRVVEGNVAVRFRAYAGALIVMVSCADQPFEHNVSGIMNSIICFLGCVTASCKGRQRSASGSLLAGIVVVTLSRLF